MRRRGYYYEECIDYADCVGNIGYAPMGVAIPVTSVATGVLNRPGGGVILNLLIILIVLIVAFG